MGNTESSTEKWIIDMPISNKEICNHQITATKKYVSPQRRIYDAFRVLPDDEEINDRETKSFPTVQQYLESEHSEIMKKFYGPPMERGEDPWEAGILPYNSKFLTLEKQKEQKPKEAKRAKRKLEKQKRLEKSGA